MSKRRLSLEPGSGKRVFLLSGMEKTPRKTLCSMIKQLNGTFLVSQDFRCDCTHVIIGKLSRGEKFLGALASGKWVVHPDYVYDSHRAGEFLDEEQYEWCGDRILNKYDVNEEMAFASRRWRFMSGAAFSGWKVAVVAGHERATIMKRLLHAGGADLFNIPLPLKKPEKIADMVTYVFVSEGHKAAVMPLVDYGVLCLKPEYISDFLIKDPVPDVMEYVVTVDNTNMATVGNTPDKSQDELMITTQADRDVENSMFHVEDVEGSHDLLWSHQDVESEQETEGEVMYSNDKTAVAIRDSFHEAQTPTVDGNEESLNVTNNKSRNLLERSTPRQGSETDVVRSYLPDFEETSVVGKKGKGLIVIENRGKSHSWDDPVNLQTKLTESVQQTVNDTSSVIELETPVEHFKTVEDVESTGSNSELKGSELGSVSGNTRTGYHKNVVEESQTVVDESQRSAANGRFMQKKFEDDASGKTGQIWEISRQTTECSAHESQNNIVAANFKFVLVKKLDIEHEKQDRKKEKHDSGKEKLDFEMKPAVKKVDISATPITISGNSQDINAATRTTERNINGETQSPSSSQKPKRSPLNINKSALIKLKELIKKSPKKHSVDRVSETGQSSVNNCHVSEESKSCTVGVDTVEHRDINHEIVTTGKINPTSEGRNACIMSENVHLVVDSVGKNKTDVFEQATSDSGVHGEESSNQGKQNGNTVETPMLKVTQSMSKDSARKQKSTAETNKNQVLSKGKKSLFNSTGVPITNFFKPVEKKIEEFWMSSVEVKSEFSNTFSNDSDNTSVIAGDCAYKTLVNSSLNVGYKNHVISNCTNKRDKTILSEARTVSVLDETSASYNGENYSLSRSPSFESYLWPAKDTRDRHCLRPRKETRDRHKSCPYKNSSRLNVLDIDIDEVLAEQLTSSHSVRSESVNSDDMSQEQQQQSNHMIHRHLRKRRSPGVETLSQNRQQGHQSREFHSLWSDIILMIIEDEFYHSSLVELSNALSYQDYPPAEILLTVIRVVLFKTDSELEFNLALSVLHNVLTLHPPVTMAMQRLYLEALVDQDTHKSNLPVAYEWGFIRDLISGSLVVDELYRRKNFGLLRFFTKLLKANIDFFTPSSPNEPPPKHMLFKIFWSTSLNFVTFNSLCRELFDFVQEILAVLATCPSTSERICLRQVLEEVLWLVAMVTETCRRQERVTGLDAMSADRTKAFIIELEKRTHGRCNADTFLFVCSRLLLPWLQVCYSKQVLDTLYDDYLVADRPEKKFDFSVIVSRYIYLLPNMIRDAQDTVHLKASTSQSSSITNKMPNKRQMAKNSKGESKLMVACIRNDVERVRELLATPGVDVNATDHAGWTALHETAFHGRVHCMKELLKWSGVTNGQKVDLMAVNEEGITPLHDAARKNKVEACRLLLQHGGTKLLRAQNIWEQTPLDIARSNSSHEVVSLLETFQPDEMNGGSIGAEISAEAIHTETDPSETRYNDALCVDGRRIYADKYSTLLYVQVVTELIVAKICLTNELSQTNGTVNQCEKCQQRQQLISEISIYNRLTNVDKNKNNVVQEAVSRHKDQQKCETCRNLFCDESSLLMNGHSSSGSQMQGTPDMDHFDVTQINAYVERFRKHLLKISRPEDARPIEESLFQLKMFTESLR